MKNIFSVILLVAICFSSSAQKKSVPKKVSIHGHFDFKPQYWGGARPTEEILERCCSIRPLANKTLYVKKNYFGKVISKIHTDSLGNFSIQLIPGEYNIYLKNETIKPKVERNCEEWFERAQSAIVVLPKGNKKADLVIYETHNPCEAMPE
jgi:hypothetical protein